ncbi:unnamed protein product, partial [Arabidopsis halleri]
MYNLKEIYMHSNCVINLAEGEGDNSNQDIGSESTGSTPAPATENATQDDAFGDAVSETSNRPPASNPNEGLFRYLNLPDATFARDAAPVIDDTDPDGGDRTRMVLDVDYEGDEVFVGRVFKNRDDCRVKIAIHAFNQRYAGVGIGPSPIAIRQALRDEHNVNVSYWKAWRARELAMDMAKGSTTGSFRLLPTYFHMLEQANAGTITELQTEVDVNGDERFKYCFIAVGGSVK